MNLLIQNNARSDYIASEFSMTLWYLVQWVDLSAEPSHETIVIALYM